MRRLPLAALLAATSALAACRHADSVAGRGGALARVMLADAPFPYDSVTAVNVFVTRIAASTGTDSSGTWTTIVEPNRAIDLLAFQQGAAADLGQGTLDPATYRSIAITIDPARSSIMHGARTVPVDWHGSGLQTFHSDVEGTLDVPAAGATIVIDFDVGRSFHPRLAPDSSGTSGYDFIPWTRAVIEGATGRISGTVTCHRAGGDAPLGNATLFAFSGPPGARTFSTGRTRADGSYTIAFLVPGSYDVQMEALASSACTGATATAAVTAGGTATLNLQGSGG